jgi:hypothetical protein
MTSRPAIREYVADALTMVAPTVYRSRGYTVAGGKMPFLVVYIPNEASEPVTIGARSQHRRARLMVEYAAEASSDLLEDQLDEKAEEIETILYASGKMGGLIMSLDLTATESHIEAADGSGKPFGMIQLAFEILYRTERN